LDPGWFDCSLIAPWRAAPKPPDGALEEELVEELVDALARTGATAAMAGTLALTRRRPTSVR
jgi:hypothetical protein